MCGGKSWLMKVETLSNKGSKQINEDSLLNADPVFGVFDGATGLTGDEPMPNMTGAAMASSIARDTFEKNTTTLFELARTANQHIHSTMKKFGVDIDDPSARWVTTAAVVRMRQAEFDWVQIGDSLILTISRSGAYRLLVTDYDHDVENLALWKTYADKKTKDIWKHILPHIHTLRHSLGVTYGAFDGSVEIEKFIKFGSVLLHDVAHIVIFTDGLILPKENPRKPDDFATFVKLYLQGGLKKVCAYVRDIEQRDPHCWKYPRYKQHDDISAIAISL